MDGTKGISYSALDLVNMIPLRAYLIPLVVLLLIIAMGRARAEQPHSQATQRAYTCADLKAALAMFKTADALIDYAKNRGATDEQIKAARRCLTRD